eukprot:COSAG04_NODE_2506_length_3995_cov_1.565708_6_plen_107_part_00
MAAMRRKHYLDSSRKAGKSAMSSQRRLQNLADHVAAAAPAASGLSISGLAPGVRHAVVLLFALALLLCAPLMDRLCAQAFTEVRKYPVKPGKMDEWVRIMEDMIIP